MEGPLSKWTNVVQGWQYRWFLLTEDAIIYYTSRDKMLKRQQRGCMRLRGASVGIDGENESLFTLTQDGKVFHLQGRDERERNEWVNALDGAIRRCSGYPPAGAGKKARASASQQQQQNQTTFEALRQKISEADSLMTAMAQHLKTIEPLRERVNETESASFDGLLFTGTKLIDTVKHAVILVQMSQNRVEMAEGMGETIGGAPTMGIPVARSMGALDLNEKTNGPHTSADVHKVAALRQEGVPGGLPSTHLQVKVPPISYSSSDDEFYDAQDNDDESDNEELPADDDKVVLRQTSIVESKRQSPANNSNNHDTLSVSVQEDGMTNRENAPTPTPSVVAPSVTGTDEIDKYDFGDDHEDFDAIYDNAEEHDIGNVQQEHGSVLVHLLSQVSVGMDLTKVTLPTFILERRSLLEMYADFFTHPDAFVSTSGLDTTEKRFMAVVRYYLNAFYAARKSGVAKKPYNPILGESFRCRYKVPEITSSGNMTHRGPFPGSDDSHLTFIAEQVSHHPPVSAFYAEHPGRRISFHAHIWTKSSFLGLSIGVANIGCGTVVLHEFDEEYTITFPSGYGRSIMSTPWVELGGKVKIVSEKTGYYADIEFLTKPFFGGKPHKIQGNCYREGMKKPILTIRGEWNGVMFAKPANGDEYVFIDVTAEPEVKKECVPVLQQGDRESRRLWRHVTAGLLRNRINVATTAKRMIEERQRREAKERQQRGETWTPTHFEKVGDRWLFREPLEGRRPELFS
ncbi:unnamed protein product, partial [Mesorhabditis belari]|uniref:Oxysterol-binding protein n=1 Tax=Mesorhabditis belari TaxID=2138241 RepID=A0AAF3J5E9_9BILA